MRKRWPYWVVLATLEDSEGNYAIRSIELQAKTGIDAKIRAHAVFSASGTTFIEAIYGPYRKDK
jgi:hypothetical protein